MLKKRIIRPLQHYLGIEWSHVSRVEQSVSALGGFFGILFILLISGPYLHEPAGALIVASMGASAVLLFAVPHGPLSQPWALIGGHLVSAFIGVSCATLVPDTIIAAALAVGLAIGAMHLLRCIHPPGGATALAAVVSGPAVHALGYRYMLTPVLLNVSVILTVAVMFNYFFKWRRYPVALSRPLQREMPGGERPPIDHEALVLALSELDTYTDISEQDLVKIYELAYTAGHDEPLATDVLEPGHSYSNGRHGAEWQVREISVVEEAGDGRQVVGYRIVAGDGTGRSGKAGLMEFARWARYRVVHTDNLWQRV
jgi:CBS domain-containing membrane protein